jgi:hypothetical protein
MVQRFQKIALVLLLGMAWELTCLELRAQGLADVLQGIREAGAPTWLKEGLRLSYHSAAASVPRSMYYFSPNENGDWESSDGKRWDRFEQPGAAGRGYTQVDVLAVERSKIVLHLQAWQHQLITGPLVPLAGGRSSLISAPGGGDWWIHPSVLQRSPSILRVDPNTLEQFKIVRMPMRIPSKLHFRVIRFQYERDRARHVAAYDTATGLLVFKATMTVAPKHLWTRGNTLLSEMWLVDRRNVNVPWAGATLPDRLSPGTRMRYEGTFKAETAASRPLTLGLTLDLTITDRGDHWVQYEQTQQLGSLPGMPAAVPERATCAAGTNQITSMWIPPRALQTLVVNQVLDRDPITREEVRVREVGAMGGRQTVVLSATSLATRADAVYDVQTGYMVRGRASQSSEMVRQTSELRLTHGPE